MNREVLARMLERAVPFMPGLSRLPALRTWTGFRPATPDKLPLVGRWPEVDGLWIAAGHEGLGITTAARHRGPAGRPHPGPTTGIDPAPFALRGAARRR